MQVNWNLVKINYRECISLICDILTIVDFVLRYFMYCSHALPITGNHLFPGRDEILFCGHGEISSRICILLGSFVVNKLL